MRERVTGGEQKTSLAREFGFSRETLYQYLKAEQIGSPRTNLNSAG
ncbi:helix-turn-helix domain-containing protein [Arthrobacter sp. Hz1]